MLVEVSSLDQVPHEEVLAAAVAQSADFVQQRGGPHARLLFTAGTEVVPVRVDHAGPVLGDLLDAFRCGRAGVSLDRVERQAEAA